MQIFVIIWFVVFFYIIAKGIGQFIENENSPVLTGSATIVDKRRKTHHHHSNGHHHHSHSYHITFETQDGEQIELRVKRYEYQELEIGDRGMLTHQGTRYKGYQSGAEAHLGHGENHCRYSHRAYPAHADCLSAVCGRRHPDHSRSHDRYSSRNYEVLHQDINTEL